MVRSPLVSPVGRAAALSLALFFVIGSGVEAQAAGSEPAEDAGVVAAASHDIVAGRVVDEEDRPLADVRVEIVETGAHAFTNADGAYAIRQVRPGRYRLRFRLIGRGVTEATVEVRRPAAPNAAEAHVRQTTVPDVVLSPDAIPLTPLSVIEQRTRLTGIPEGVAGSSQILRQEDLERTVTSHGNVHEFLRSVPGMNIQEEDGFGLRPNIGMRGSGSERSAKITLMEDGVLVAPAPYAAPSAYYFPTAGRMDAIEVRKGSSQIKYGPRTIGGALNFVSTPIPTSRVEWDAEGAMGGDLTRRLEARAGGSTGRFGWLAETYQLGSDGFKDLPTGEPTGFRIGDYLAKLRWNSDPGAADFYQQVELKLGAYDQRSDETYLGLTDADFASRPFMRYAASGEDVINVDQRQVSVRHFLRLGRHFDLTTTAYHNDVSRNWYKLQSVGGTGIASILDAPDDFADEMRVIRGGDSPTDDVVLRANNRAYEATGLQTALGASLSTGSVTHRIETGLRYHRDEEDRFQHEDGYRMSDGRLVQTSAGAPGSQSNRVSNARAWAAYVEDRVSLGRVTLTPGFRLEFIDFRRRDFEKTDPDRTLAPRVRDNDVTVLLPGIGASVEPTAGLRVFGGVHRGFGPPGPGADAETEAESSVAYELGVAAEGTRSMLQLVGFFNDYDNILGAATLSSGGDGSGDLFNGGAARIVGLEASASADVAAWGQVEVGDELPYVAPHRAHGRVSLVSGTWRLTVDASYQAAMRTVAGQGDIPAGEGTDGYFVLGLGGEAELGFGTLFAGLQNATDQRYIVARRPAGARPGLPRTLELGLRIGR